MFNAARSRSWRRHKISVLQYLCLPAHAAHGHTQSSRVPFMGTGIKWCGANFATRLMQRICRISAAQCHSWAEASNGVLRCLHVPTHAARPHGRHDREVGRRAGPGSGKQS
eukprot:1136751-Pelagomonas_calceolata.AAC.1